MLVQTIVGAVECGGVTVRVAADVVVVELFLELVEFVWVTVGTEECSLL